MGIAWRLTATGTRQPLDGVLRLFGRGFGYVVRGIGLVERTAASPSMDRIKLVGLYRYQTPEEAEASHRARVVAANQQKQADWTAKASGTAKRVAAMPEPLRQRFEFFMRRPEWGWDFGFYELFCCEEAVKIHGALGTADAIKEFSAMGPGGQKSKVPGLAWDEHSGNTFGTAVKLAHCLASEPDLVPKMHGALCPLVGCAEYGCWSTTVVQPGPTERTE